MAKTYYIDWINGDNKNDGLSENTPKQFHDEIELLPGDTVLFKRGNMLRDWLKPTNGSEEGIITFGSYGEGPKPIICGSTDVTDPENWVETEEKNIWKYVGELVDEPCNLVYNGGECCGELCWLKEDMKKQGDWYDEDFGNGKFRKYYRIEEDWFEREYPEDYVRPLYMYSEKNPGEYYTSIEYVEYKRFALSTAIYARYENLTFINSGVHGVTGPNDLQVENCDFHFIGGACFSKGMRIRLGNGVESWQFPKNVLVKNCLFNNIYDSCLTHQGFWGTTPAENVLYTDNLCMNYGMGAYEVRDLIPINTKFENNICIGAGKGFAMQTNIVPRNSEIYPFPMGHHLFIWRMAHKTDNPDAKLEIKNNIFYDAPVGSAVFSFITEEPEEQFDFDYNTYYTTNPKSINRYGDTNYKPEEFDKYVEVSGLDKHSKYEKIDIRAAVKEWFEKTGRGEVSEKELDFYGIE